jgi:hypothetical protein
MVTNRIIGKASVEVQKLLQTLVEIQAIAYACEGSRSPRSVLRFHNLNGYTHFSVGKLLVTIQR